MKRMLFSAVMAVLGALSLSAAVETGVWTYSFKAAKAYVETNDMPLVLLWGAEKCEYCKDLEEKLGAREGMSVPAGVAAWMAERQYVFCFVEGNSTAKDFAKSPSGEYPYVSCYWPAQSKKKNFSGRDPDDSEKYMTAKQFMEEVDAILGDYGRAAEIAVGQTPSDRLEAVTGRTTRVMVPVSGFVSSKQQNYQLKATFPGGAVSRADVVIAAGKDSPDTLPVVEIPLNDFKVGETVSLELLQEAKVVSSNSITFVEEPENNPKNPRWLGERTAETLAAGEWTMDLDVAQARAAAKKGPLLTLIGGSLWCPDCVKTDHYLVDTPEFKAWLAKNDVTCVAIDVPNVPSGKRTSLLTYEATSVSDRYVNATFPPQERVQSGAGYLSRHEVDPDEALQIAARNAGLLTNAVPTGLCRPEQISPTNPETGTFKTGIPCLLLQDADGRVLGRLYQFNNVSPGNTDDLNAYIQRIDELLALAEDPTEEANRDWRTATDAACGLSLRTGSVKSSISAIDTIDCWQVKDVEHWTRATFSVKGKSETGTAGEENAMLSLWRLDAGKTLATQVGSAVRGNLANGFALRAAAIGTNATWFVRLEVIDTSEAFKLNHVGDSTVGYELVCETDDAPGAAAFDGTSITVKESAVKNAGGEKTVSVPIDRAGGATGDLKAKVSVGGDAEKDRYELLDETVCWADGDSARKYVRVKVFNDNNADGQQEIILSVGESFARVVLIDDDRSAVGLISIADTEPALAKKATLIAVAGATVRIGVSRIKGASERVSARLSASAGSFLEEDSVLVWSNRQAGVRWRTLELPMSAKDGKVTVSLTDLKGAKADSSTKKLTIQLVSATAPAFDVDETGTVTIPLTRYVATPPCKIGILNLTDGGKAKINKLSGSIPSGLSVKLSKGALEVSGTPTSKANRYEAVYQISETVGKKTVKGRTVRLVMPLVDVSALPASDPRANPYVAKSHKLADSPVWGETRLMGVLSGLTIVSRGKLSAKYRCSAGTVSFSSKNWSDCSEEGTLSAHLTSKTSGYTLDVTVTRAGKVSLVLTDPAFANPLEADVPEGWSSTHTAKAWKGQYLTALTLRASRVEDVVRGNLDIAALGDVLLTLKMTSTSAFKKGVMTYSGILPNGTSFSGSATLCEQDEDTVCAPVVVGLRKDFLTACPVLKLGAAITVRSCEGIGSYWRHTESATATGNFEIDYEELVGVIYDSKASLAGAGASYVIEPAAEGVGPMPVKVTSSKPSLNTSAGNPAKMKLSFSKSTGLVSGSFSMPDPQNPDKKVTATYKGVALQGSGCDTCNDTPWMMGAYWHAAKLSYVKSGKTRSASVKTGDRVVIEDVTGGEE